MKIAYIIPLLFLSTLIYAQESKKNDCVEEDQALVVKQAKEQQGESKFRLIRKELKKPGKTGLASDQGLEVKKQESKPKAAADNSGKLFLIQQVLKILKNDPKQTSISQ